MPCQDLYFDMVTLNVRKKYFKLRLCHAIPHNLCIDEIWQTVSIWQLSEMHITEQLWHAQPQCLLWHDHIECDKNICQTHAVPHNLCLVEIWQTVHLRLLKLPNK